MLSCRTVAHREPEDGNTKVLLPLPESSLGSQPNEPGKRFRFARSNCQGCNIDCSQAETNRGACRAGKPLGITLVAGDGFEPPTFGL
jgi:hypothetical protein